MRPSSSVRHKKTRESDTFSLFGTHDPCSAQRRLKKDDHLRAAITVAPCYISVGFKPTHTDVRHVIKQDGVIYMHKCAFIISMIIIFVILGACQVQPDRNKSDCDKNEVSQKHQTGFSIVAAEADSISLLPAARDDQQIVRYDYKYLLKSERGKPRYLLLPITVDVPLLLTGTPELIDKGQNGFPELLFELTPEKSKKLEKLTSEHLGGKVAFIIDGEPVTLHKIRSSITGGQFQLTRCTDTACRIIYTRLVKNK
jgi:hypothetical protein